MFVRSLAVSSLVLLGAAAAFAGEGNNLAAVERPAGTGVYYSSNTSATQQQASAPARGPEVADATRH